MSIPSMYNLVKDDAYPILGGMYPGRILKFQGNTPPGAQRFTINLLCGPNLGPKDDIAFHLNFRFNENCVVRNHWTAGGYGVEERCGCMPLRREQRFELMILCEPQAFKVTINDMHFCNFVHRISYQRISHFDIEKDCQIKFVGFEGARPPAQMYMVIPSIFHIPGGMRPGCQLRFHGNTPPGAKRFTINLICGSNMGPKDDMAFILNVRFDQMCIVRNHWTTAGYGVEERCGRMPLNNEQSFELLVLCEPQALKVTINGVHFCDFVHRIPYQRISHFDIKQDCHMYFVRFEGAQPPAQMSMVIPLIFPISGGVYPGRVFKFQGKITPGAERFTFNLLCGPNLGPKDDIAFHLNFRFNENSVVRNHWTAGGYGVEERCGCMPLKREQSFELMILCEPQAFKVTVNGEHFCDFVHRISYQRISHYNIEGHCQMQFVGFEISQPQGPIYMKIGDAYAIPGCMYEGRMLKFQGNTPPGAQRFAINLQCGPNMNPRDDIAFHLNFRFDQMCVVRNHLVGTVWGVEERSGGMPLSRGQSFELLVLCEPQSLKVTVNGVHFCDFVHRILCSRISHFEIEGDCQMQFLGFEGGPATWLDDDEPAEKCMTPYNIIMK